MPYSICVVLSTIDPVRDLDIICEELRLKDEEKLLQYLDKLEKVVARGADKKLKPEYDSLLKIKGILVDEKKHLRFADWNVHDVGRIYFINLSLNLILIIKYLYFRLKS